MGSARPWAWTEGAGRAGGAAGPGGRSAEPDKGSGVALAPGSPARTLGAEAAGLRQGAPAGPSPAGRFRAPGPALPASPSPWESAEGTLAALAGTRSRRSAVRPPGEEPGSGASFQAALGDRAPASERAQCAAIRTGLRGESMGSDRSAPGRPGSLLGGREAAAARPQLLLLLVLLCYMGRGAAAEDAEVHAEVRTPALPLGWEMREREATPAARGPGGGGAQTRPRPGWG